MFTFESFNDIHSLCRKYNIRNYTINSDGSIDVDGDVHLHGLWLEDIPLNFNYVKGDFDCRRNDLTSLKGSPKKIDGSFHCNNNKLTNLEFSPESIPGDFNCLKNNLTTLKGGPKTVNGYFDCNLNELTNLEFSPKVGRSFYCAANKLTTLKGGPKSVNGVFHVHLNQLSDLKHGPESVNKHYICSSNLLTTLSGSPKTVNGDFNINGNNIFNLDGFDCEFTGNFFSKNTPLFFLDNQEYDCLSMIKKLKIIKGKVINIKKLSYLNSIFNFKRFKIDDLKVNYDLE